MKKERNLYLNIVKGVAIFIMIWSHTIIYSLPKDVSYFSLDLGQIIGSFNMPILMLVSGYLFYFSFQKKNLKELIISRSKPLLFAIVFYGLFHYFATNGVLSIIKGQWKIIFARDWVFNFLWYFWFLYAVLISSLIISVICKKTKKLYLQLVLIVLSSIIIYAFVFGDECLFMYPYYVIGFYYAKYKEKINKFEWVKYLSLLIYPVLMLFFESKHFIYTTGIIPNKPLLEIIEINLFRWIVGLAGSIFVLTLVDLFYRFITIKILNKNKKPLISLGLNELGENSLQYYTISVTLVSFWFMEIYKYIVGKVPEIEKFMKNNLLLHNYIFTVLLTISFCIILYFIVKIVNKTFLCKIFFGKNPKKYLSTNQVSAEKNNT